MLHTVKFNALTDIVSLSYEYGEYIVACTNLL